jgi:hypothetical protein
VADWKQVLWSNKVHWGWAQPVEEFGDQLTIPTANYGGGSLMFCGCIRWPGTGYGTKLETSLTKEVCV